MPHTRRFRFVTASLALFVLAACESPPAAPEVKVEEPLAEGVVGPAGGSVVHQTSEGDRLVVQIPTGAFDDPISITMAKNHSVYGRNVIPGTVWTIRPEGVGLQTPGRLQILVPNTVIPFAGIPPFVNALRVGKRVGGEWMMIEGDSVRWDFADPDAPIWAEVTLNEFGTYGVMWDPCYQKPWNVPGVTTGLVNDESCRFNGGPFPQVEDFFRISTPEGSLEGTGFRFDVETKGDFLPIIGAKSYHLDPDSGKVYGFDYARGSDPRMDSTGFWVALPPGERFSFFVGNRNGEQGGSYRLTTQVGTPLNGAGCQWYFLRPPHSSEQRISQAADCNTTIDISGDSTFVGAPLIEEYWGVRVLEGETIRVTVQSTDPNLSFFPFPTLGLPGSNGGGFVQNLDELSSTDPRTVEFTATAEGYFQVAVSGSVLFDGDSVFTPLEGNYTLDIRVGTDLPPLPASVNGADSAGAVGLGAIGGAGVGVRDVSGGGR